MVISRINERNRFVEEATTLGLLAFFTIAEQVTGEAHNMVVNMRIAVQMHSRTDREACVNANYGQLKILKRNQNVSLQQLFVEVCKSSDCML